MAEKDILYITLSNLKCQGDFLCDQVGSVPPPRRILSCLRKTIFQFMPPFCRWQASDGTSTLLPGILKKPFVLLFQWLNHRKKLSSYAKRAGDHTRLRGEYSRYANYPYTSLVSPPLVRGVQSDDSDFARCIRITPARAGSTLRRVLSGWLAWDRPRLRGEYNGNSSSIPSGIGSSPLARGILCNVLFEISHDGITPACAGSTERR